MPPAPVRRPLTVPAWLLLSAAGLILSPLILAGGALAARVLGRPQPQLLARLLVAYFARELAVLVACGGLWLVSGCGRWRRSDPFQRVHYQLLGWFVGGLAGRAREILGMHVAEPEQSEAAVRRLGADGPVLFFSRHAGPGDTMLLTDLLMTRYRRLPSVVFKDALALDPSVDLLGHRLPHAVLDQDDADECKVRIEQTSARLGPRGVLLLFPEGANVTARRRRRSLAKLRRKGMREEASAAQRMEHVLPPHPSGALAALAGAPRCDVVFGAHTGLGLAAFPRQLWRDPPVGRTLRTRMWLVPAAERPTDPDEQVRWLYEWWERIDRWLAGEGEPRPEQVEASEEAEEAEA